MLFSDWQKELLASLAEAGIERPEVKVEGVDLFDSGEKEESSRLVRIGEQSESILLVLLTLIALQGETFSLPSYDFRKIEIVTSEVGVELE